MRRGLVLAALPLGGCAGIQSAADGAGRHAAMVGDLFTLFLWITGFFFLLVLLFLGWAILRRRSDGTAERGMAVTLAGWAGLITLGLFALTIASFFTDRWLAAASAGREPPLRLKVTAQQWWWQIEYLDPLPANRLRTANVIHLPAGRPVEISLAAEDVIHSFWVPNLAGKQDLIPGRTTDIQLLPTRVGRFRGQCAEFCGLQHAHMALDIIVEPAKDFAAWRTKALAPAPAPQTPQQKAGYAYFMTHQCASCHAISGTPAQGTIGPDLTGVAGRLSLAAGTLPNNRAMLQGWIANPQTIKPGNRMPTIKMSGAELEAVTAYLETLS